MAATAWLFPGQGSQKVGMGSDLLAAAPELFDRYMALADEASGLPVRRAALEGPIEELTRTDIAQPALFALSLALAEGARDLGLAPAFLAGHSLGEYTAAVDAQALTLEDGMRLVALRGRLMAEIQSRQPGAMAAVIGLDEAVVETLCESASELGEVGPANLNTANQIVVSGVEAAVDKVVELASAAGAQSAMRLRVGAAFHSPMMKPVQSELAQTMASFSWKNPTVPIVSNASGRLVKTGEDVRAALIEQIASPVLWAQCVQTLLREGCQSFLELGPGRILSGLVRQIDRGAQVQAADSPAKLAQFAEA